MNNIKHLITGGCSFSTGGNTNGWPGQLTNFLKNQYELLTTNHTGANSSGQELIQKRVCIAILDAIKNGINCDNILVVVMWSGTSRKAWYIDNQLIIDRMTNDWADYHGGMTNQFVSLKYNSIDEPKQFKTKNGSMFDYNATGGWYSSVNGSDCKIEFVQQHYLLDKQVDGIGKTHISLENIILLQNFCRLHNIKMVNQFYMDHVYNDIERHKDHECIEYIYKQFNHEFTIKQGQFEYLHEQLGIPRDQAILISHDDRLKLQQDQFLFNPDGFHPSDLGNKLWTDNILFPFINEKLNYDLKT